MRMLAGESGRRGGGGGWGGGGGGGGCGGGEREGHDLWGEDGLLQRLLHQFL